MHFIKLTIVFSVVIIQFLFAQPDSEPPLSFTCKVEPWYKHRKDGKAGREVLLYFEHRKLQQKATITVECDGKKETTIVVPDKPLDSLSILLPDGIGLKKSVAKIAVSTEGIQLDKLIDVPQRKQWTVYIYPHSHVDIGYTAPQEEVLKLQKRNIDVGIDLARKTQNYPVGARFVWNPEATWVVKNYLKTATPKQKASFIEAVKKGWIKLDAGFANINTSVCSDEELMHFFDNSNEIKNSTGVPITSMVQVDVPGAAWGIVSAAAANGVKGFVSFPNYYDMRAVWDHRPFYWMSPDGKDKILFLQGSPYGYGYRVKGSKYGLAKLQKFDPNVDRVSTNNPTANFLDPFIFQETENLENRRSPYDIFAMTWSMADNCLIDADLPEAVKKWNEQYAYPKLIIAGSSDILNAFEKKYADIIPTYKGDFTEYWTDGLGSDAKRVGMARRAKENLAQVETLAALLNQKEPSIKDSISKAWEYLLLAAEHTWGYQNPKEPMAKIVEARKAANFEEAERMSKALLDKLLQPMQSKSSSGFAVINTLSWKRNGIVTLTAEQSKNGDRVVDEEGKEVLSQRLSTGELIFAAQNIPPFASKNFTVLPGKARRKSRLQVSASELRNQHLSVSIDSAGNVKSLVDVKSGHEFIKDSAFAFNSYQHIYGVYNGKDTSLKPTSSNDAVIHIKEKGPLLVSLEITSKGEGINWLKREIKLYDDQSYLECINTIDKIRTRIKEGIHFGFDFNIPKGAIRVDAPLAVVTPEKDQLPAGNRNWMAFQRWIDISNKDRGITWTSIETPVVELGALSGTVLDGARQWWLWKQNLPPAQTIFSWLLNNHWDTNFPLEQSGIIRSKYAVMVHDDFDAAKANQFGLEEHRPLLVIETKKKPLPQSVLSIDNNKIMASFKNSADDKAFIVSLRSVSENTEKVNLRWGADVASIDYCTPGEKRIQKGSNSIALEPFENVMLKVVFTKERESIANR